MTTAEQQDLESMSSHYMNAHSEFFGLYLPVKFKLFGKYTTNCHPNFDILISTEAYRKSLGKSLPVTYFDDMKNEAKPMRNQKKAQVVEKSDAGVNYASSSGGTAPINIM